MLCLSMLCLIFPAFLYQLLLDQTHSKPTTKHCITWQTNNKALHHIKTHRFLNQNPPYPPYPPYAQTNSHLLPQNRGRSSSSDHPFATNHPQPTSTTQKRRPICHGSHPAHGHRFLNQNPPMKLTVPYKPNPLLFSLAPVTHNSQTLILLKLPKNPRSKNSHHKPNFRVLASANPNGSDGFSWLSLTRSCVVALLLWGKEKKIF